MKCKLSILIKSYFYNLQQIGLIFLMVIIIYKEIFKNKKIKSKIHKVPYEYPYLKNLVKIENNLQEE